MRDWVFATTAPGETRAFARTLGEHLIEPLTIWLSGPLGAGKTCFAQGFALGLGVPADEPVTSPSYTLMNLYQGRLPLYHFDLYRLSHPDDLDDLGFDEYLAGEGVSLVEWADRFVSNEALAEGHCWGNSAGLHIQIQVANDDHREIVCRACGTLAEQLLAQVSAAGLVSPRIVE